MSLVNCANNSYYQNVLAGQHLGGIYYQTIQTIGRGTELLVSYGRDYEKDLDIDAEEQAQYPYDEDWEEEGAACGHCGRGFVSQEDVDDHIAKTDGRAGCAALRKKRNEEKVADGLAKQICDVCGYGFRTAWELKKHKVTHTTDRPFICPEADC